MKRGTIYGVGVGPGDPELMTLKALRLIRDCDVIAVPHREADKSVALKIARAAAGGTLGKMIVPIDMPMTRDATLRLSAFETGVDTISALLGEGKNVVFLTLGDPSVYSTYGYLHACLTERGYDARLVPGVTSFCASAAALGIPLCEDREQMHLIPGGTDAEEALTLHGTKVFMKGNSAELKQALKDRNLPVFAAENCGMENEVLHRSADELNGDSGYFTVTIVKEQ